ncbi:hypothetical protein JCM10213_002149 [Rhodosporidiobolus nylandii]
MADAVRPVASGGGPVFVRALYDYSGADPSSLSFRQGEILEILSTLESGWWDGVALNTGERGWLPSNYCTVVSEEEAQTVAGGGDLRRGSVSSVLSSASEATGTGEGEGGAFSAGVVSGFAAMSLAREPTFSDFMALGSPDADLTSFSAGGDIFSEIAAAAQADSTSMSLSPSIPSSSNATAEYASHPSQPFVFPGPSASTSTLSFATAPDDDEEEDFWVPKMTRVGQLFYYNTRSGETSRDMPIDGKGDGVRIDPSEFSIEDGEAPPAAGMVQAQEQEGLAGAAVESDWSERVTADGRAVYYVNLRTGEQTWDPPSSTHISRQGSTVPRPQPADVVLEEQRFADEAKRTSMCSDDSALDSAFVGSARRERRASADILDTDATPMKAQTQIARAAPRPRQQPQRKQTALTAELLGPPPPPLIVDLAEVATRALQELIHAVGTAGVAGGPQRDHAAERERLARLGDAVVHAVRLVLHSSGVLEHPVISSPFAATASPANEITGSFRHAPPLPPSAQADLRPFSRRLISTLSKLTFSLRAMWGLLETTPEDQHVGEDDSPADPEEVLRRNQARQQALAERKLVRDARFEHETKLRSEIMQGTRDVSDGVLTFLERFQAVVAAVSAAEGRHTPPREQIRAPKAAQGSLRANATALLRPGGGFGGNWRGNGFVSLPTPHSSPTMPTSVAVEGRGLAYAWPARPIAKNVSEELKKLSEGVVLQAQELAAAAASAASGGEEALPALFEHAAAAQESLAAFLTQAEDVDVAAGVDFQLPRSASRRGSGDTGVMETAPEDTVDEEEAKYRKSVLDAKPLFAEFEARKQALYDLAPRLAFALQNAGAAAVAGASSFPAGAGQPAANHALSFLPRPITSNPFPDLSAVRDVASDFSSAAPALCSTLDSLVGIAEVQAAAPRSLRAHSLALRESMFEPRLASSTAPSTLPSDAGHSSYRMSVTRSSASHDSTFRSSYRSSADSDFFFSGTVSRQSGGAGLGPTGAASSSTSLTPSSSGPGGASGSATVRSHSSSGRGPIPFGSVSAASSGTGTGTGTGVGGVEVLSPGGGSGTATGLPPGWDGRRRGSVATTQTGSSAGTANPSLTSVTEYSTLSPSRSSHKNIQKLLGEVPSVDPAATAGNYGEPARPWYLDRDWADDELSFTMENTVKGGTLRGLVIAATSHEGRVDSSYLSAFLMTYRTFCTSAQLLDQLIDRYLIPEPEDLTGDELKEWELKKLRPIRARVTNLLKAWVREYMDHEDLDPLLLQRIREFALNTMTEKGQSLQICKSVDERLQGAAPRTVGNLAPGPLPQPVLPRSLKKFKLLDLDPLEIARQLTIMDSRLFQRITPQECLSKAWPKEFGSEAPNISAMIDMSNAVTRWVTETILEQEDLKKRANIVKHFIAIAERCLQLNNFSTLIHIIAGLNSTPIHRLRRTWETVNQKAMILLGGLNNVMRPDKNYKEYREILRKAAPPCVPFLGVYLTDWVFIGDGNPDMLREKPHQINFNKRSKAAELILGIQLNQRTSYNLQAVNQVAKWLQERLFPPTVHPDSEGHLYSISLALEPRERDDEKIARLLSESGFL